LLFRKSFVHLLCNNERETKKQIKIMENWSLAERIAFHIRGNHPQIFDEALDAIVKEDLENFNKF